MYLVNQFLYNILLLGNLASNFYILFFILFKDFPEHTNNKKSLEDLQLKLKDLENVYSSVFKKIRTMENKIVDKYLIDKDSLEKTKNIDHQEPIVEKERSPRFMQKMDVDYFGTS